MPEWGDLLLIEGGTDRDRAVAAAVQPGQTVRHPGTRFQDLKGPWNMPHFTWYKVSARSVPDPGNNAIGEQVPPLLHNGALFLASSGAHLQR